MTISFVIPAYNEEKYIGQCIQSILDHWSTEFKEIIVVDNDSTDRTSEVAAAYPHVKVINEPHKGTNRARQRGFVESTGDVLAYLDADTMMPNGWEAKMVYEFNTDPNLVCLSGPFHYYDLPPLKKFFAEVLWWIFAPLGYRIMGYAALGANMVLKRKALEAIHGFDTNIIFHGDDTDTARRLSKVGKVQFKMTFYILGSGRRMQEKGLLKTFFEYGVNYTWTALKHRPYIEGPQDTIR